jgi:hypothetical protein
MEDADGFRARLTTVDSIQSDGTTQDLTFAVTSSPSEFTTAVSEWLDEFLRHAQNVIDGDR